MFLVTLVAAAAAAAAAAPAVLHVVLSDLKITAEPGENITLPCRSNDSRPVVLVQWNRTDLGSEYVLLFRDDQIDPDGQHPSYQNRVDLQMKDGDVSLVLRNVTTNDNGTYECRVAHKGERQKKLTRTIQLQVVPPGDQDGTSAGPSGLTVGLVVPAVIVFLMVFFVIIFFIVWSWRHHPPLHEEAEKSALPRLSMSDRTEKEIFSALTCSTDSVDRTNSNPHRINQTCAPSQSCFIDEEWLDDPKYHLKEILPPSYSEGNKGKIKFLYTHVDDVGDKNKPSTEEWTSRT